MLNLMVLVLVVGIESIDSRNHDKTPVITTKYGQLQGVYRTIPGKPGGKVATYLGVPYATPPVTTNRFSPTRTLSQWVGVHEALSFGPACPQKLPDIHNETEALKRFSRSKLNHLRKALPVLRHQSEDCLYLNIYVPHLDVQKKKLSVLVFVHGPSYEWGSASLYDGSVLASRGNIIVITINYRLGILGFFNPNVDVGSRATVANYGLMDQLAALHWVQENIEKFGGDRHEVTVMGHGTGAACLNFLVISPASAGAGLFKRAILMSGSSYSSWALVEDPTHYAVKAAYQLGCDIPKNHYEYYETLLHCLRNRTIEQILNVDLGTPKYRSSIGPSIDGVTITLDWKKTMIQMGEENRTPVDLLIGITDSDIFHLFSEDEIQDGFPMEYREKILRTYVTNNYRYHLQEILLAVNAEYTDWTRPSLHQTDIRDVTGEALHDAMVVAPMSAVADQLNSEVHKTFYYVLNTHQGYLYSQDEVFQYFDELTYVFGAPFSSFKESPKSVAPDFNFTDSQKQLSESMMRFWSNFVKNGNPDEPDLNSESVTDIKYRSPTWDPFDRLYQRYLEFGQSRARAKDHYRAVEVALWNWLVPNLERVGARHGPDSPFHRLPDHNLPETFVGPTRPFGISPYLLIPSTTFYTTTTQQVTSSTTLEPIIPTALPYPARDVSAPLETPPSTESDFYTTALGVTIAIGCSLLILNILAFLAIYHRSNSRMDSKRDAEAAIRLEQPQIITDSTDGKSMESIHSLKIPSPSHCDAIHSPMRTPCEGDTIREWPPNYSTCYIQEIKEPQELSSQINNGSSTLRRSGRPIITRTVSIPGHDEVYLPADQMVDAQKFSEMRL